MHCDHHHAETAGLAAPHAAASAHPADLASLGADGAVHVGISQLPRNDEPRELVGSGAGLRGQGQADIPDCASPSAKCKRFNTLRARLALAGWTLAADAAGALTAARWGMARDLDSLAAVEAFAAHVGAPS